MTAPTYIQLVEAIERVVDAYCAEPPAGDGDAVARVLAELDDAVATASSVASRAREQASHYAARRLPAPTGQPVEPDPDSRPPAHAGGVARTVPNMRRVT